jgi:cytochrome d ubiquinol oxidase subunit II
MFEKLTYLQLQEYWWLIIAVLAGLFVFMNFVQGGQSLLFSIAKSEDDKDLIVNSLGRKWELSFTTLVMFGGALFAAFPLFYATSFGGAYYVWMAILFSFIIQAVAYEYRKKPGNVFGERTYELFLFINGSIGIFLVGAALATLFTGGNFIVDDMHLSRWSKPTYGLEALGVFFNIMFGLMLMFLARVQGALYLIDNLDDESIQKRARVVVKYEGILFLLIFIYIVFSILTMNGYSYNNDGKVYIESFKYLHNFMQMPIVSATFVVGALLVVVGIILGAFTKSIKGIWFSGIGSILVVIALFLLIGYNNSVYYPSLANMQSSLTIQNSSSSRYTLVTMSYVSLMVPFVLAYIIAVWRAMDKKPLSKAEIKNDPHHY